MTKPTPKNVRDLRLMYDTTSYVHGNIEYKQLSDKMNSRDYVDGEITSMRLRVVPNSYGKDEVVVRVEREQVTNLRDGVYNPKVLVDWEKAYTFDEFRESPFYEMCVEKWSNASWDTHLMDEHEVFDDDTRWGVYAHVYESRRSWFDSRKKTGRIEAVDFSLDEDGHVEIGLTGYGKRQNVYNGNVWELRDIIDEHAEMKEQLGRLKEHGIDLDGGTLSIRLWEEK